MEDRGRRAARTILHADMDAFYASVEQRDRPELRGRPVVVGGTSGRGVVMAASYEARPFGIRSAMPTAEARARCPDAVFVAPDMSRYRRIGAEVRRLFAEVSPEVEPISLDEAFIDITGSIALLGPPLTVGRRLKERVRAVTGLAVSVGIGPGKMVAKIASDVSKPDGLLEVRAEGVAAFLGPLPVGRLWGIGPVTEEALRRAGIVTIGELGGAPVAALEAVVGPAAHHLIRLAAGDDHRVVVADREARSCGEEGTFEVDVGADDDGRVRAAIIAHAEAVGRRLRRAGVEGRVVLLKMKLAERRARGRFRLLTRRATLPVATDDGKVISDAALALWTRHRPRAWLRLIGVTVADLASPADGQLALFRDPTTARRAALNAALDRIVARWGRDSIARAAGRQAARRPPC